MKTDALIILDGFGYSAARNGNAIMAQGTPYFDRLCQTYPHTLLEASGLAVGLPAGQMGNSEVGHLNLGAGRVVYQDITRIDKSIEDGDFYRNPVLTAAMQNAKQPGRALHLVGLLSDGGVHSSNGHLYALLKMAAENQVPRVYVHVVTDGRDTSPTGGIGYVTELEKVIAAGKCGRVATVVGRYYYMDRDNRWQRVKQGYDCVFAAVGSRFATAAAALKASYDENVTDEFVKPCVIGDYAGVQAGDSMIFYNFRADRAREISRAATEPDFDAFVRAGGYKPLCYVGMTRYDEALTRVGAAFPPRHLENTLGAYLAACHKTQVRIAETEKYAHVTFFFNGGEETSNEGETRILVPSPQVATYDLKPKMSAYEVAAKGAEAAGLYDAMILNFANCDMVGHTGVFAAAKRAVAAVDVCLKTVVEAILKSGGSAIVTADHGNAEVMLDGGGNPMTAHTTNPVPLVIAGEAYKSAVLRRGGALCDVAPTLLMAMGLRPPKEMEGRSLIE